MTLDILLVEDDATHAYLVERALRQWKSPYQLHMVSTAEEALEFIHGRDGKLKAALPHLTLLDLHLPKAPGFAVLKVIKENPDFRKIAVIVMSSSLAADDIKRAVELQANAYLRKPSEWSDIAGLFLALEAFWRLDVRFSMPDPATAA